MPVGPIKRLRITLELFSNESWYLALPIELAPEGSTLAGATFKMVLVDGPSRIEFTPTLSADPEMPANTIVTEKDGPFPVGSYKGDLLITFPGGHDAVAANFVVKVKRGIA